ncbi:MAG: hypothetical protein JXR03_20495 [Cyclobacteriaceae bacterium]
MLRFIFSVLIIGLGYSAIAQVGLPSGLPQVGGQTPSSSKPATMKEMRALRKNEPKDWSIKYLKFSYDVIPTGRLLLKSDQKGQEAQASIAFYKYFFVVEGGYQDFTRNRSNYEYNSSGTFFRLGTEVNMMKINEHGGAFTFGLRYAQSHFSDAFTFIKDVGFGDVTYQFENPSARLIWMEITTGLNLPIKGNVHMGYTIRYKVFRNVSGLDKLRPFDVPGFGRYENKSTIGFSYYIGWAIPFKKLEEVKEGTY